MGSVLNGLVTIHGAPLACPVQLFPIRLASQNRRKNRPYALRDIRVNVLRPHCPHAPDRRNCNRFRCQCVAEAKRTEADWGTIGILSEERGAFPPVASSERPSVLGPLPFRRRGGVDILLL